MTKDTKSLVDEPQYKHVMEALDHVHQLADGEGSIVCPRCGGTLHYEKHTIDTGREWSKAACETERCISWIA